MGPMVIRVDYIEAIHRRLKAEIMVLQARVEELEREVDCYKVRDDQVMFAMKRLKEVLNDPPWEKV